MFRQWAGHDRDAAIAWQIEQNLACPGCGHPRDESTSRANQFAYRATPVRCHACKAKGDAHKQFTTGPHDPAGISYRVDGEEH